MKCYDCRGTARFGERLFDPAKRFPLDICDLGDVFGMPEGPFALEKRDLGDDLGPHEAIPP